MTFPGIGLDVLRGIDIGLGTWQWGDRLFWGFGQGYSEPDLRAAFDISHSAGIQLFDTAEVYGLGRSERYLGQFLRSSGAPALVATKFFPMPWRWTRATLVAALRGSLRRLGGPAVDLYQIHWPLSPMPIETLMDGLADTVEAGLARAVGVSNFDVDQTRRAYATLKRRGVPLASNQVPYSLLNREVERDGLLAVCQELGVRVIAYSPLAQGLLTGKYGPDHAPPGVRRLRWAARLRRIDPLIGLLREIGAAHATDDGPRTPAQVAVNWCMCKGTLPIPGAKNERQARENAGAIGWRLTEEEVARLDRASDEV
jgi:aryl-alcohol dehydrogenase-like predicted oxidoreductase